MSNPNDRSGDERWRDVLAPLRDANLSPPPGLEDRIALALRVRRHGARRLGLAVAAMLLLALGGVAGRWWALVPTPPASEPRFLLLLFEGPSFDSLSSTHDARVREYGNWARVLASKGQLVDAGELAADERRLGPLAKSEGDLLAGVFIVKAKDEAEAVAIASTCPHLKHGGGVTVRLIRSS